MLKRIKLGDIASEKASRRTRVTETLRIIQNPD